jgi:hypothetical protein
MKNNVNAISFFLLTYTTLLAFPLTAEPIQVQSFSKKADGVLFKMEPGTLRIQVCTDAITHVIYAPGEAFPAPPVYVVKNTWIPVRFRVIEDADAVSVATAALRISVDRKIRTHSFLRCSRTNRSGGAC